MREHETIIAIHDEDVHEGFFRFGTSKAASWNRLLRRVGGEQNLIDIKKTSQGSKVTYFSAKVPTKYLGVYFGIGHGRKRAKTGHRVGVPKIISDSRGTVGAEFDKDNSDGP